MKQHPIALDIQPFRFLIEKADVICISIPHRLAFLNSETIFAASICEIVVLDVGSIFQISYEDFGGTPWRLGSEGRKREYLFSL